MLNEYKQMTVDGLEFWYRKNDFLFINFNGKELNQLLFEETRKTVFDFKAEQKEKTKVKISSVIENLITVLCKAVKKLENRGEYESAAYFATNFFEGLTAYSELLKNEGRYAHACNYLLEILSLLYECERRNKVKVHKGHPYFFLAFYYLLSGDLETGFVYAHNAIKEDKKLGKLCPDLEYPKKAPIYLTIFLVDDPYNRMINLVKELRKKLDSYIYLYNKEFGKNFTIKEFDNKFLQNDSNPKLEGPRYLFSFSFWSLVELSKKTNLQIQDNEFSQLRNLNWVFNLCLIIDKVLEANPRIGKKNMGSNVKQVFEYLNLLSQSELKEIERKHNIDINRNDPDQVLKVLLSMKLSINSVKVPRLAIHYLIAWNLRNYGGHKIKQQKCLVESFNEIFNILMKCIISSVDLL